MAALGLLSGMGALDNAGGSISGGDAGPATSGGLNLGFGGFGGLNFSGGTSGQNNQGSDRLVIVGALAVAGIALFASLRR